MSGRPGQSAFFLLLLLCWCCLSTPALGVTAVPPVAPLAGTAPVNAIPAALTAAAAAAVVAEVPLFLVPTNLVLDNASVDATDAGLWITFTSGLLLRDGDQFVLSNLGDLRPKPFSNPCRVLEGPSFTTDYAAATATKPSALTITFDAELDNTAGHSLTLVCPGFSTPATPFRETDRFAARVTDAAGAVLAKDPAVSPPALHPHLLVAQTVSPVIMAHPKLQFDLTLPVDMLPGVHTLVITLGTQIYSLYPSGAIPCTSSLPTWQLDATATLRHLYISLPASAVAPASAHEPFSIVCTEFEFHTLPPTTPLEVRLQLTDDDAGVFTLATGSCPAPTYFGIGSYHVSASSLATGGVADVEGDVADIQLSVAVRPGLRPNDVLTWRGVPFVPVSNPATPADDTAAFLSLPGPAPLDPSVQLPLTLTYVPETQAFVLGIPNDFDPASLAGDMLTVHIRRVVLSLTGVPNPLSIVTNFSPLLQAASYAELAVPLEYTTGAHVYPRTWSDAYVSLQYNTAGATNGSVSLKVEAVRPLSPLRGNPHLVLCGFDGFEPTDPASSRCSTPGKGELASRFVPQIGDRPDRVGCFVIEFAARPGSDNFVNVNCGALNNPAGAAPASTLTVELFAAWDKVAATPVEASLLLTGTAPRPAIYLLELFEPLTASSDVASVATTLAWTFALSVDLVPGDQVVLWGLGFVLPDGDATRCTVHAQGVDDPQSLFPEMWSNGFALTLDAPIGAGTTTAVRCALRNRHEFEHKTIVRVGTHFTLTDDPSGAPSETVWSLVTSQLSVFPATFSAVTLTLSASHPNQVSGFVLTLTSERPLAAGHVVRVDSFPAIQPTADPGATGTPTAISCQLQAEDDTPFVLTPPEAVTLTSTTSPVGVATTSFQLSVRTVPEDEWITSVVLTCTDLRNPAAPTDEHAPAVAVSVTRSAAPDAPVLLSGSVSAPVIDVFLFAVTATFDVSYVATDSALTLRLLHTVEADAAPTLPAGATVAVTLPPAVTAAADPVPACSLAATGAPLPTFLSTDTPRVLAVTLPAAFVPPNAAGQDLVWTCSGFTTPRTATLATRPGTATVTTPAPVSGGDAILLARTDVVFADVSAQPVAATLVTAPAHATALARLTATLALRTVLLGADVITLAGEPVQLLSTSACTLTGAASAQSQPVPLVLGRGPGGLTWQLPASAGPVAPRTDEPAGFVVECSDAQNPEYPAPAATFSLAVRDSEGGVVAASTATSQATRAAVTALPLAPTTTLSLAVTGTVGATWTATWTGRVALRAGDRVHVDVPRAIAALQPAACSLALGADDVVAPLPAAGTPAPVPGTVPLVFVVAAAVTADIAAVATMTCTDVRLSPFVPADPVGPFVRAVQASGSGGGGGDAALALMVGQAAPLSLQPADLGSRTHVLLTSTFLVGHRATVQVRVGPVVNALAPGHVIRVMYPPSYLFPGASDGAPACKVNGVPPASVRQTHDGARHYTLTGIGGVPAGQDVVVECPQVTLPSAADALATIGMATVSTPTVTVSTHTATEEVMDSTAAVTTPTLYAAADAATRPRPVVVSTFSLARDAPLSAEERAVVADAYRNTAAVVTAAGTVGGAILSLRRTTLSNTLWTPLSLSIPSAALSTATVASSASASSTSASASASASLVVEVQLVLGGDESGIAVHAALTAVAAEQTDAVRAVAAALALAGEATPLGVATQEVVATCFDGMRTPATGESDVDCGGAACAQCDDGHGCRTDSDCVSGLCSTVTLLCSSDGSGKTSGAPVIMPAGLPIAPTVLTVLAFIALFVS